MENNTFVCRCKTNRVSITMDAGTNQSDSIWINKKIYK